MNADGVVDRDRSSAVLIPRSPRLGVRLADGEGEHRIVRIGWSALWLDATLLRRHDLGELVRSYFDPSSFFVRHLNDGRNNPSVWDNAIEQFAEVEELPLDRFGHACRILNCYYPQKCCRAWTCLDDNHCVSKGQHAQALAEFELRFNAAQIEGMAECEDALSRITEDLRKGRLGEWLWEALVEDVQPIAHLSADGRERIARWFACRALRAYYPYVGGQKYWDPIKHDYPGHARHALELIRFEYEFTRSHRDGEELERERRIAEKFASRLRNDGDRRTCTEILNGKPTAFSSSTVPITKGVYARFRQADDPVPMYVGKGYLRSAMADRHTLYSGDHEIYLRCFEDADCDVTELKLLAVFDPQENDHRWKWNAWIKHPDELPEWFL